MPDSAALDSPEAIARDIAAIARVSAVPSLLQLICDHTGMGFAAVARVTDDTWIACAVHDGIAFGLKPGDALDVHTTLCKEARAARQPVVIDHASRDPVYAGHHTPRLYNIESYVSVPILRRDGSYFGNLCAIDPRPAGVSNPRTLHLFQLIADLISNQLDSEDRLLATETALLNATETAELREQFIAVLGHDMRNPLSAVAAVAQLLSLQADEKLVRYSATLKSASRRMMALIDDVLDFARGRLGAGMVVEIAPVADIAAALRSVIEELRLANPRRTLLDRLTVDRPVGCDITRVQQLLSNLLGNALVYGAPDRPVMVTAAVEGGDLVLTVTNYGAAIAAEHLDRIFEPYWRVDGSRTEAGLGLGLYICAQIVGAHGGTLAVSSSDQDGTRFTARLPVGRDL